MKVFYSRFFKNQFKRNCMPDGIKVGSVALSPRGDWRMPSDASVNIWLKSIDNMINSLTEDTPRSFGNAVSSTYCFAVGYSKSERED